VGGAVLGVEASTALPVTLGCHIEYGLQCADGRVCHRRWQTGPLEAVTAALEIFDAPLYNCRPHTVVCRLVSDWSDPGVVAVKDGQK
jgi:hypothetical protein